MQNHGEAPEELSPDELTQQAAVVHVDCIELEAVEDDEPNLADVAAADGADAQDPATAPDAAQAHDAAGSSQDVWDNDVDEAVGLGLHKTARDCTVHDNRLAGTSSDSQLLHLHNFQTRRAAQQCGSACIGVFLQLDPEAARQKRAWLTHVCAC